MSDSIGQFVTLKLRKSKANPGRPRFVSGVIEAVEERAITLKVTHYDSWRNRESHQRVTLPRADILSTSREISWPDPSRALADPATDTADSAGAGPHPPVGPGEA